jgi:ribose/xylose/arabinose/galactoside ABC-type transport system permease subunit
MPNLGRLFIFLGITLVIIGVVILALNRFNVPIGRLPGDMTWRGRGWTVSFPLATSVILSIVLTLILWIINRLQR